MGGFGVQNLSHAVGGRVYGVYTGSWIILLVYVNTQKCLLRSEIVLVTSLMRN